MTQQQDLFGKTPAVRRVAKCTDQKLMRGKFTSDAMGYLIAWVKKHGPAPFSAEEVTLAAIKDGVAPPDLRHWGDVFRRAAKEGYIRRSSKPFRRAMGNNTVTLGWKAC